MDPRPPPVVLQQHELEQLLELRRRVDLARGILLGTLAGAGAVWLGLLVASLTA